MSNLVGKKPKKPDWKRDLRMSRSNADHQGGLESVDPQSRCRLQTCILLNLISFAPSPPHPTLNGPTTKLPVGVRSDLIKFRILTIKNIQTLKHEEKAEIRSLVKQGWQS